MTVVEIDQIAARIITRPATNGIRLIGVDGPSGSGKSVFAGRMAAVLGATLVEIDNFVSWTDFAGWWPRFDDQVLGPLLARQDARYQVRDWVNDEFGDSLGPWTTLQSAATIIVEGVTSTRRAVASRLTYAVWVEAPESVRLRRGIERDGESHRRLWLDWMVVEAAFFEDDHTRERADIRIDTASSVPHDPNTQVVAKSPA